MWKRKDLKTKAKQVVKKNYWTAILVCFIIALLTGEFGTSIIGIWQGEDTINPNFIADTQKIIEENIDLPKINKIDQISIMAEEKFQKTLNDFQLNVIQALDANLNSITKPQKFILKIFDAVQSFRMDKDKLAVSLIIMAILSYAFTVFIADPLIVGGRKYFLKARKSKDAKATTLGEIFKKGKWLNITQIMFLRNIYNALWYLTIIGGVIKTYEYRMIPYIIAENPTIKRKKAFKLSKQMMKGNKWKTFVLDLSFFGWNFLSVLTFGILSLLYVNPYNSATFAELYITLKEETIKNKYEYYEELKEIQ